MSVDRWMEYYLARKKNEKAYGQRSLVGYSALSWKSWAWLSD